MPGCYLEAGAYSNAINDGIMQSYTECGMSIRIRNIKLQMGWMGMLPSEEAKGVRYTVGLDSLVL